MTRFAILCVPLFLLGCASTPTSHDSIGDTATPTMRLAIPMDSGVAPEAAKAEVSTVNPSTDADVLAIEPTPAPVEPANAWILPPASLAEESLHGSRFTVKAGYYSTEDVDTLDDGFIVNVSWMRYFTKILAIELEAGYLEADGDGSSDIWGIPLMVNGRLNVPIWVLDLYGGVGVGTIYYDFSADTGGSDVDGWELAGNAFLGSTINLADSVALGLEGKYYVTDSISDLDGGLDAFALMLTLGFSR